MHPIQMSKKIIIFRKLKKMLYGNTIDWSVKIV